MPQEHDSRNRYTVAIHQELLEDALSHAGLSATVQKMKTLGGTGLTVKNNLIALVRPEGLALRLSAEDQQHLLTVPGASRLSIPGESAHDNQWILLPGAMLEQSAHYAAWVKKAWKHSLVRQGAAMRARSGTRGAR